MDILQAKKESDEMDDSFDEADAALVLTSISCSPPTGLSILKAELPFRSKINTPPLSCSLPTHFGSPANQLLSLKSESKPVKHFQCLWKQPKCTFTATSQDEMAQHVRTVHLSKGRSLRDRRSNPDADAMQVDGADANINEEDFYYTEVEPEVDAMDSVVHSFRHLQTASPGDVLVAAANTTSTNPYAGKSAFSILPTHQHSPDSAYGSVPAGQTSPDHDYQKKGTVQQTPAALVAGIQQQELSSPFFSQSLPNSRPISFLSSMGLGVEAPILEQATPARGVTDIANPTTLGAAFLSVLQRFGQSPSDKDSNSVDLSTSLPSNWLFPAKNLLPSALSAQHQFPVSSSGGGGVPFHVIAAAAANNNVASSSDPNIANSICLSSSPPSTSSPSPPPNGMAASLPNSSTLKHHRRIRSEVKKCRKVYGVEKRDMWCTQCRWKKACTRFLE